jgi:hypothetical protein
MFHSTLKRGIYVQISPSQQLRFPQDVTLIDADQLVIVDAHNRCVIIVSTTSDEPRVIVQIDTARAGNKLGAITAVAFAEGGTDYGPSIFVADAGEHCVHVCLCYDPVQFR